MVYRSYLDHGTIQVAVYDNRLEITSPGKLPMGQTLERMKEGYSKIRNEALAHAFSYMNLIEYWGSGIPRIIGKVKAAGLREPEFIGGEVDLRINIYRGQVDTNNAIINASGTKNGVIDIENGISGVKIPQTKERTQVEKLLQVIEKNPSATPAQMHMAVMAAICGLKDAQPNRILCSVLCAKRWGCREIDSPKNKASQFIYK